MKDISPNMAKLLGAALCAVVLLLCAWAEHKWGSTALLSRIEDATFLALGGLGIYHMSTTPKGSAPGGGQGGFASLGKMFLLMALALALALLQGCAGLNAQGVLTITYNTPAAQTAAFLAPGQTPAPGK